MKTLCFTDRADDLKVADFFIITGRGRLSPARHQFWSVNGSMGIHVANRVARSIMRQSRDGRPLVTVLGVTFKENVPDIRNTRAVDIVRELEDFGITVQLHDPKADGDLFRREYQLALTPLDKLQPAVAIVLAVAHASYRKGGWSLVNDF